MTLLPPRLPPLPPLPVRAGRLALLLALILGSTLLAPVVLTLLWPAIAFHHLVPVIGLFVGLSMWMLLLTWLVVLRPYHLRFADIGLRPTYRVWYRLAVLAGVLCMPAASLINLGLQSLLNEPINNPQLEALAPEGFNWPSFISMLVVVGVLAPFVEEIIFRGLVYGWLRKHMRFIFAAPISAVFFAAVHGIPELMPALAFVGLILAAIVERSGSLWSSMIVHGTFNSLMTITFYAALAAGIGR